MLKNKKLNTTTLKFCLLSPVAVPSPAAPLRTYSMDSVRIGFSIKQHLIPTTNALPLIQLWHERVFSDIYSLVPKDKFKYFDLLWMLMLVMYVFHHGFIFNWVVKYFHFREYHGDSPSSSWRMMPLTLWLIRLTETKSF